MYRHHNRIPVDASAKRGNRYHRATQLHLPAAPPRQAPHAHRHTHGSTRGRATSPLRAWLTRGATASERAGRTLRIESGPPKSSREARGSPNARPHRPKAPRPPSGQHAPAHRHAPISRPHSLSLSEASALSLSCPLALALLAQETSACAVAPPIRKQCPPPRRAYQPSSRSCRGAPWTYAPSGPVTSTAFIFPVFSSVVRRNSRASPSASERNPGA